ncbi:hypothetical protein DM806_22055 [Sphingobium lactosutens]|uniref:phosphotransferase n=1 Tax=Sphingobium lactosutens TaxID=522773 RepID=UPI0015BF1420|nr:phosphotransferase [Sphingobium lactosutens]NWK98300.1 hypothetical protein [Sphingobium lactosutens]
MSTVLNIPLRYDAVTPEWMTGALRGKWPDVIVKDLKRGPIFGYKQNKFRVQVDYADGDGPTRNFIVKGNFPGQDDPSTGTAWSMASELRSIRDVAPLVAAPFAPECYHIDISEQASAIVMEDMSPKGAIFFDAFHTLTLGQAMAFMDAFARMHASAWNSDMFKPGGAMGPGTFAGENRQLVNEVYLPSLLEEESWRQFVEMPRGRAIPRMFQKLDRVQTAWDALWSLLRQADMTVIHGDEHLGNLFVAADGTPGVIDWVARPEHWPIGIAYFMVCALDIADRRQWDRALISHYVSRLAFHGATHVPNVEDAWFLYRCTTFYPVVTWMNNSAVWQPEAVNTANTVRAAVAALDHDAYGLLGL